LIEEMIMRDQSPATLAWAIPLLHQIVAALEDSELGPSAGGLLANALWQAGRHTEAETLLRQGIADAVAQGNYHLASGIANALLNLLMAVGRLDEALAVVDEKTDYNRRAGLGPWTQLLNDGQRLQVLNAQGRYSEVLGRATPAAG
jgi:hypothetical protein